MTESEAIAVLKMVQTHGSLPQKAKHMSIKALEKQIPKKWESDDLGDGEYIYKCPCCNEYWALMEGTPKDNEYNYCPKCGQKLEWGDTDAGSI